MQSNAASLFRPDTLKEGTIYLWVSPCQPPLTRVPVSFISYCPCPAMVIVADREGEKLRIPRDEIFSRMPACL